MTTRDACDRLTAELRTESKALAVEMEKNRNIQGILTDEQRSLANMRVEQSRLSVELLGESSALQGEKLTVMKLKDLLTAEKSELCATIEALQKDLAGTKDRLRQAMSTPSQVLNVAVPAPPHCNALRLQWDYAKLAASYTVRYRETARPWSADTEFCELDTQDRLFAEVRGLQPGTEYLFHVVGCGVTGRRGEMSPALVLRTPVASDVLVISAKSAAGRVVHRLPHHGPPGPWSLASPYR
jgi:hypothetical protein